MNERLRVRESERDTNADRERGRKIDKEKECER